MILNQPEPCWVGPYSVLPALKSRPRSTGKFGRRPPCSRNITILMHSSEGSGQTAVERSAIPVRAGFPPPIFWKRSRRSRASRSRWTPNILPSCPTVEPRSRRLEVRSQLPVVRTSLWKRLDWVRGSTTAVSVSAPVQCNDGPPRGRLSGSGRLSDISGREFRPATSRHLRHRDLGGIHGRRRHRVQERDHRRIHGAG